MKITFFFILLQINFFSEERFWCLLRFAGGNLVNETLDTLLHTSWRLPKQFYQADPEMYKKGLKIKLYLAWCFQDRKKENAPKFSSMKNDIKIAMLLKTDQ